MHSFYFGLFLIYKSFMMQWHWICCCNMLFCMCYSSEDVVLHWPGKHFGIVNVNFMQLVLIWLQLICAVIMCL